METAEFDLDRSVLRAWSSFRIRLADVLDNLADDDILTIEAASLLPDDGAGASPFVQVVASGEDLQAELSSNVFLAEDNRLDNAEMTEIARIGWQQPSDTSSNFNLLCARHDCERLAAIIVAAFRTVFSVPHPTFLDAGTANEALGISQAAPTTPESVAADPAQVQLLVDEALTDYLGEPPNKDDDGDIPIRSGSALVFIRVLPDEPLIELKSPLVVDIEGRTRAAEVIADLNANWRRAKFVLVRDVVVLLVELPTDPFVADHLTSALRYISRLADDLDDELADRLGGRLPFIESARELEKLVSAQDREEPALPTELVSLLHLAGPASELTTDDVLQICVRDRDLIIGLLQLSTDQENAFRRTAEQARINGSQDTAAVADTEAELWRDVVDRLRVALRVLITGPG